MRTKTKISLRIDDDLLKVLKNNSTGNLTAYIEDLLSNRSNLEKTSKIL
jgi:hypothetical protein